MSDEEETRESPNEEDGATPPTQENEMEILQKEMNECKDKYLRLLAEMENARKRLQKEKQESVQYAIQNTIVDFLSPIDHLENALKFTDQASPEVKQWAMGFQMILTQFKEALSSNGVFPVTSLGTPFDPHLHEAIEMVMTDEIAPGMVIEEHIKGYRMGDRTIRPARVKVSKAIPKEAAPQPNGQETSDCKE